VSCETVREALSARLDGESEPVPAVEVDSHLDGCAECAGWLVRAQTLTRSVRVRAVHSGPDLVDAVLAAAPDVRRRRLPALQLALGVVATTQVAIALSQLVASAHHGGMSGHLFNEGVAWNLGLGIGLLFAAVRAERAGGLLPTLSGFVAVLAALSALDLINGDATASRVVSHLPLVAGLALLYLVHGEHRRQPTPDRPVAEDDGADDHGQGSTDVPAAVPTRRRHSPSHLRPTGRRAA
jgi:predicted anti-sigma-YlaC factor YlaD